MTDLLISIFEILGAPLALLNTFVNWLLGFDAIKDFINIVAFVLPWNNITPLISLIIGFFLFRIIVAIIKTIWELLPVA